MASLSRFQNVSEEELNAFIQKAVPQKTKIATRYDIQIFEGKKMNLKYQFDSFTRDRKSVV